MRLPGPRDLIQVRGSVSKESLPSLYESLHVKSILIQNKGVWSLRSFSTRRYALQSRMIVLTWLRRDLDLTGFAGARVAFPKSR